MGFTEEIKIRFKRINETIRFCTGSSKLDALLQGDLATGRVIELIGPSSSGKTELCHTLAVTCQLPIAGGGAAGCCVYIDTECGVFSWQRFAGIIERYRPMAKGIDLESGISWCHAKSLDDLYKLLDAAKSLMLDSKQRFALLILDSVTAVFRSTTLSKHEMRINLAKLQEKLREIVDKFGIAVVVTNQKSHEDYDESLLQASIDLDFPVKLSLSCDASGGFNCESTGFGLINGCKVYRWRGRAPFRIGRTGRQVRVDRRPVLNELSG